MLPPTVMADPISATTWPKAVVITAARANRASRATVHAVRHRPAPSVSAVRRMRGSTPWTAAAAAAGEEGGDEADLEGEERDAVHFAVAREQQGDGAPKSLP